MKGVKIILYIAMASYITFPTGIMSNCSGDHHKAYYTYIHTKVYTFYYMWHMGTGGNSWLTSKCIFFVIRRTVLGQGVCLCIHI